MTDTPTPPRPGTDLDRTTPPGKLAGAGPDSLSFASMMERAEVLARSKLVPRALEGNPAGIALVGALGQELGVPFVTSLSEIHVIENRPSPSAQLRLALIRRYGHEARFTETSDEIATIIARRHENRDDPNAWVTVTWTIEQARKAGLVDRWVERKYRAQGDKYDRTEKLTVGDDRGIYDEADRRKLGLVVVLPEWAQAELDAGKVKTKDNWQKYPADMLRARCATSLSRMEFSDVIAGLGLAEYTPDELGIPSEIDLPDDVRGEVILPDPDDEPAEAELVDEHGNVITPDAVLPAAAPEPEPPIVDEEEHPDDAPPEPDPERRAMSGPSMIAIRFGEHGITDRATTRLAIVGRIIEREVETTKDLVPAEVRLVLETLAGEGWTPPADLIATVPVETGGDTATATEPVEELAHSTGDEAPAAEPLVSPPPTPTPPPPPPPAPPASVSPEADAWNGDKWREFLTKRGVKVTELLKEASKLAREKGIAPPPTLDEVTGSGLADLLVGYVEDLAQSRGK